MSTQDLSEQQQIRREKRQRLIDEGRDAYPVEVDRTTSLKDLRAKYDGTLEPGATSFTAGRLGELQVVNQSQVLLGAPHVFTKADINDFDF